MGYPADAVRFFGEPRPFTSPSARGGDAVRNSCPICGGLVFGGRIGQDDQFTIYAGSLDDPSRFAPSLAIFTQDRPEWAVLPPHLKAFAKGPGAQG